MINQAPIVRYTASVCEIFFSDFREKTFSAESELTNMAQGCASCFDFLTIFERTANGSGDHVLKSVVLLRLTDLVFKKLADR
jgi:hypothetical protein